MGLNRSAGAASLVMLIASAVLCVFAVLAISGANSDYSLSKKSADAASDYYAAYAQAQKTALSLDNSAAGAKSDASALAAALADICGVYDVAVDGSAAVCKLDIDSARYFELRFTPSDEAVAMRAIVRSKTANDASLWEGEQLELWDGQ